MSGSVQTVASQLSAKVSGLPSSQRRKNRFPPQGRGKGGLGKPPPYCAAIGQEGCQSSPWLRPLPFLSGSSSRAPYRRRPDSAPSEETPSPGGVIRGSAPGAGTFQKGGAAGAHLWPRSSGFNSAAGAAGGFWRDRRGRRNERTAGRRAESRWGPGNPASNGKEAQLT